MTRTSRMLVVGAMVVGLVTALAGPASATTGAGQLPVAEQQRTVEPNRLYELICIPIRLQGQIVRIVCYEIPVAYRFEPFCPPRCGPAFDWRYELFTPPDEYQNVISEKIVLGLAKLGAAAFAQDQATRDWFRQQAWNEFVAAATYNLHNRMSLQRVGLADANTNTFDPQWQPWHPWYEAVGQDIADGMALLDQYLTAPPVGPRPSPSPAAAQFDEAYTQLSQKRVIPG